MLTTQPKVKCDQCDSAMMATGGYPLVYVHEHGCPNIGKAYDTEERCWVQPAPECFECGCPMMEDNRGGWYCDCQDPIDDEEEE